MRAEKAPRDGAGHPTIVDGVVAQLEPGPVGGDVLRDRDVLQLVQFIRALLADVVGKAAARGAPLVEAAHVVPVDLVGRLVDLPDPPRLVRTVATGGLGGEQLVELRVHEGRSGGGAQRQLQEAAPFEPDLRIHEAPLTLRQDNTRAAGDECGAVGGSNTDPHRGAQPSGAVRRPVDPCQAAGDPGKCCSRRRRGKRDARRQSGSELRRGVSEVQIISPSFLVLRDLRAGS